MSSSLEENFSEENNTLKFKVSKNIVVRSPGSGKVIFAGDDVEGHKGKQVVIQHPNGFVTSITGLKDPCVQNDQEIHPGESLGQVQQDYVSMEVLDNHHNPVNPLHYFTPKVPIRQKKKI